MASTGFRRRAVHAGSAFALVVAAIALTPAPAAAAGAAKPAIFHDGTWYLRNSTTAGAANATFRYGRAGDLPVMGDWNGDGNDTVGLARFPANVTGLFTWHLRDANSAGGATVTPFEFGTVRFVAVDRLGSIPIVGDWDGDGDDTIGVAQFGDNLTGPITFHLRNSNTAGPADVVVSYGRTDRDQPIVGDWDGDGIDTVGVVRAPTLWLLRNSNTSGPADLTFTYGTTQPASEFPVVGDWDGNGTDTPGLLRNVPSSNFSGGYRNWLLRNTNTAGPANINFIYGSESFAIHYSVASDYFPRLSWR